MSDLSLGIISLVSFILGAFFSGCETAFIASDPIRLRHMSKGGSRKARTVLTFLDNPQYLMSSVLVGTNLSVIGCTATFTAVLTRRFGETGASAAVVVLVPLFLIFNEILPKGIFLYYSARAAMLSAYPLKIFSIVLYPVIKAFSSTTDFLVKAAGIDLKAQRMNISMDELLFHLEDSEEAGLISPETLDMVSRAVKLRRLSASEIMIPLEDVDMVESGQSIDAFKEALSRSGFSRLPVFRGTRSNITGILSIHKLLAAEDPREGEMELEATYVVSLKSSIEEILLKMQNQGCHMAFVEKDGGLIVGMLTLEDILERLVGAIEDEYH